MMKTLIVYCHPSNKSFNHAVLDVVVQKLEKKGAETRILDLYQENFDPLLTLERWNNYEDEALNRQGIEQHMDALLWCDSLIFIYPTWWYGLPAMLKGWCDRVLAPGVAFKMPQAEGENIKPALQHIKRLALFTTCGASRWLTLFIGAPGKRTILRGVRLLCAKRCKTAYAAHFLMDTSSEGSRAKYLDTVARKMDRWMR